MTQASSSAGSVRSASRGSSRGSQASTSAGGKRHRAQAEVAVVHHHLAPAREHRVTRVLHHAPRRPRGRVPRRRGKLGHDPLDGVRAAAHVAHQLGRRAAGPGLDVARRCSSPPGYWSRSSPRAAPSSRHTTLSALRAMWVSTWPTLQPGSRLGRRATVVGQPGQVVEQRRLGGHAPVDPVGRGAGRRRAHEAGMVDCPSSMSAMTARMNSSASSVMPPATPP